MTSFDVAVIPLKYKCIIIDSLIACFRSAKDQSTTKAILYKSNHQTHLPCNSEYKISSPVVVGATANGSILDSIDEMSETANQLLADVQSDEKNVGNVCILDTDHIVFDMRNENKYCFCVIL